ncbi:MAG: hypothetical protein V1752_06825, partial [Candidatus Firestonebacteria bacterium]
MRITLAIVFVVMALCGYSEARNVIGWMSKKAAPERLKLGSFSISAGAGFSFPAGDITNVLNGGVEPDLSLSWNNFLINDFSLVLSGSYCVYTGKVDTANLF